MTNILLLLCLLMTITHSAEPNRQLQDLSAKFWQWRYVTQPATGDDILRVERPDSWTPDYSPDALTAYRQQYTFFRNKLNALLKTNWTRSDSVDFLCLRSAIERVNWELNVLRLPERNPDFYLHQTLGALYELLLIHTPMTTHRATNMIVRIESFPKTLSDAIQNLKEPSAPFARIALDKLQQIENAMTKTTEALKKLIEPDLHQQIDHASESAISALIKYRKWIEQELPNMTTEFSCGRDAYVYFLNNIAYIPHSPEELVQQGRLEWNRSVAFETMESVRNKNVPPAPLFTTAAEQIKQEIADEQDIRNFMEANDIMSVPEWLQHYVNKKMPAHIIPLSLMGVVDDLTSETRLDVDGVSYIPEPHADLSYFRLACAQDPRPIIIHEGVPGHYFQMAISWSNPNPIRRRYIDSGANEGIGLYVEELMQQFGLFDDRAHTREIIYNFMRLRALRVEVDIRLALGTFTIEQAGDYLARTVPMDRETAIQEAGFFAYNPGQAITYQIGKIQILKFLSDARIQMQDRFNLRQFHDYLMLNGNVPIALLRWEYLGVRDEIEQFFNK
jgi:uncharacterized protein (DUF885 family)